MTPPPAAKGCEHGRGGGADQPAQHQQRAGHGAGRDPLAGLDAVAYTGRRPVRQGEKDAEWAQKLGQLQPFLAVLLLECMGQLAYFGPS
jgi:hypothetical protein